MWNESEPLCPVLPVCYKQGFFGTFHSAPWDLVRHLPIFFKTNMCVFSDRSGFNLPVATFLSVFDFCHKLFDMFSYKMARL